MRYNSVPFPDGPRVSKAGPGAAHRLLAPLHARLRNLSSRVPHDELTGLIEGHKVFEKDSPSWSDRGVLRNLVVVERGFAFQFTILADGKRHIGDFFGPGAICNWSRFNEFAEQDDILFKAGTTVSLLNLERLGTVLEERPGMASVFKRHELARAMRKTQRIRTLISHSTRMKILLVLLDLFDEFRAAGIDNEWLRLPLTQEEIADLLGVTPVHVSRTLTALEEDGTIARERRSVRLLDPEGLTGELEYRQYFRSRSQS